MTDDHSTLLALRAKIVEHVFIGEALRALWRQGRRDIEVLRAEVDAGGYDLIMVLQGITRHIQLKTSNRDATTGVQKVSLALARKPSGCVLWIRIDPKSLELGPFLWFGGKPGEPLPDIQGLKVAKHAKGDSSGNKAERPGHRIVPKRLFKELPSIDDVLDALFGEIPN